MPLAEPVTTATAPSNVPMREPPFFITCERHEKAISVNWPLGMHPTRATTKVPIVSDGIMRDEVADFASTAPSRLRHTACKDTRGISQAHHIKEHRSHKS